MLEPLLKKLLYLMMKLIFHISLRMKMSQQFEIYGLAPLNEDMLLPLHPLYVMSRKAHLRQKICVMYKTVTLRTWTWRKTRIQFIVQGVACSRKLLPLHPFYVMSRSAHLKQRDCVTYKTVTLRTWTWNLCLVHIYCSVSLQLYVATIAAAFCFVMQCSS